ncbi:P-loop containing nucleoside triphosphate hydrolase protein [Tirmania nivea]|nr:P-loop containing nucleoside triphosphate hydrolase protein [Tirmania nivea]
MASGSSSQAVPSSNSTAITLGLHWENVTLSVTLGRGKKAVKKQLLEGVSGYARRGEITAIMGPSGSGKTTLVNVLSGRLGKGKYDLQGKVTFEGKQRDSNTWKFTTAYVEQEDIMYDYLTVEETIVFSAMVRLPNTYTKAQKIARAKSVIDTLSLSKVKDTKVGSSLTRGVSGGERKRCAIGVELVTSPRLMFLDEPTSGLDSHSAYNVVATVREVARQGIAVMCTIHQPAYELFSMFDKVLLLAQGRVAFHGTIPGAIEHFTRLGYPVPQGANAADHFISLLTEQASDSSEEGKNKVKAFLDAWGADGASLPGALMDSSSFKLETAAPASPSAEDDVVPGFALGFFEELLWLTRRYVTFLFYPYGWSDCLSAIISGWMQTIRDKQQIYAPVLSSTFVGLILAFTFYRLNDGQSGVIGKAGLLFFHPVNISFSVLFPIISYLPLLNKILIRERSAGAYRVSTFYISRYLIEVPMAILSRLILFVLVYWVCGFRPKAGPFFIYMGISCMTVILSVAMGLFVGSTSNNLAVVQAITPSLNVVFLLFGGFLLPRTAIGNWFIWLYWISYLRYVFAGLSINEFKGRTLQCTDSFQSCYRTGDDFLQTYDLTTFGVGVNVALLTAIIGAFAVIGYLTLRRLTNPKLRLDI